jgi:iron complex transport system ATP-binding protein
MQHKYPPLLEFKNLTVIKGRSKKVLNSIDVTINIGENVAIIGPNGSGKSSLIKTITREYYPVYDGHGTVCRIWGEETWNIFDLRYLLGIVSEDLQKTCARYISARELVLSGFFSSIGLYNHQITAEMEDKTQEVLEFLEVAHLADRKMTEVSSGEARRILIARALAHDPKALVLDEPTNSLDLHALHKFQNTMIKIASTGTNIIMVTHRLQDIIPEISRIILIKDGRIFKDGVKEDILTQENISRLFDIDVEIIEKNGYYYAWV